MVVKCLRSWRYCSSGLPFHFTRNYQTVRVTGQRSPAAELIVSSAFLTAASAASAEDSQRGVLRTAGWATEIVGDTGTVAHLPGKSTVVADIPADRVGRAVVVAVGVVDMPGKVVVVAAVP